MQGWLDAVPAPYRRQFVTEVLAPTNRGGVRQLGALGRQLDAAGITDVPGFLAGGPWEPPRSVLAVLIGRAKRELAAQADLADAHHAAQRLHAATTADRIAGARNLAAVLVAVGDTDPDELRAQLTTQITDPDALTAALAVIDTHHPPTPPPPPATPENIRNTLRASRAARMDNHRPETPTQPTRAPERPWTPADGPDALVVARLAAGIDPDQILTEARRHYPATVVTQAHATLTALTATRSR